MLRVFRWDGKEVFINPDNILFIEQKQGFGGEKDKAEVIMSDGKSYTLSGPSYDILTGQSTRKNGPGKAGFDVV